MRFSLIHQSGKWNASLAAYEAAGDAHRRRSQVVTWTETTGNVVVHALGTALFSGWHTEGRLNNWRGECAIQSLMGTFEWRGGFVRQLTEHRVRTGGGTLRPPVAARVTHLQAGNQEVFPVAVHMVSGVDAGGGWSGKRVRVAAYRDALRGLRELLDELKAQHPQAAIVLAWDCNLNLRRLWVRVYLRRQTGLTFDWSVWKGAGVSFRRRLIDGVFVHNCRVVHAKVLPGFPEFDHDPVRVVIEAGAVA